MEEGKRPKQEIRQNGQKGEGVLVGSDGKPGEDKKGAELGSEALVLTAPAASPGGKLS